MDEDKTMQRESKLVLVSMGEKYPAPRPRKQGEVMMVGYPAARGALTLP
uniref:Uncharacterized protein n=1 Tax=Peronospora matthiolae TaxID=2874970 RepID=A0AAV1TQ95_9STRA